MARCVITAARPTALIASMDLMVMVHAKPVLRTVGAQIALPHAPSNAPLPALMASLVTERVKEHASVLITTEPIATTHARGDALITM